MKTGLKQKLANYPICVDLDGTLIRDDVTIISLKKYLSSTFNIFSVVFWFLHGRARLKYELANRIDISLNELHLNEKFLAFLKQEKQNGKHIYLATACNEKYAHLVADFLGIFDGIFASDAKKNLRAEAKAKKLSTVFGNQNFIYAGNSSDDIKVWNKSAGIIFVGPDKKVKRIVQNKAILIFD